MATELAKAYVQIVPSAKGIEGAITEQLGGEASAAGSAAGESLGQSLIGKLKGIIATAGIGKTISSALNEGAALQQSIGGVETLFKGNADTIKKYADEAYRSAGMSANAYMETVTGFSASLLQGLGGDTAAAAEVANMAVIDMSDNANKMGTSIENIQNAYQGFAKQNYTMLDNLKLGYGGTKTEMERLLADAEKISGVKYDISNLSDVYNAIHVVQEEMDIAGTTSKEAASTFSGSLAAMKAAGSNLLANLTLGNDIGPSLQALNETVFTFISSNLLPMVGNLLMGLPEVVNGAMDMAIRGLNLVAGNSDQIVQGGIELVSQLVTGLISAIPCLAEAGLNLIASLAQALLTADWVGIANNLIGNLRSNMDQAAGEILGTDGNIISSLLSAITAKLPGVLAKGNEIVTNIANGILQNLPTVISAAGDILTDIVSYYGVNLPVMLQSGMDLISNLAQGLLNNLPAITISIAEVLAQLLATIGQYLPDLLQAGISLIGELAAGLINAIPKVIQAIPRVIENIKTTFGQYDWKSIGSNILDGIAEGIKGAISRVAEAVKNAAKAALDAAKDFLDINSPSGVMEREVGHWIPYGTAVGIEKNLNPITGAMKALTDATTKGLQEELANTSYSVDNIPELTGNLSARTSGSIFDLLGVPENGQNFETIVTAIVEQVVEKLMNRIFSYNGNSTVISLNINGEEFARLLLGDFLREMRRQGLEVEALGVT